jgi:hypothetical protein
MSNRRPGLGDFGYIIAARAIASLLVALGVTLAALLLIARYYGQAALGLAVFLFVAFWAHCLVRDLEHGKVLLPFGYVYRSKQPLAFWIFFCLYCVLIPLLAIGTAEYLLGF